MQANELQLPLDGRAILRHARRLKRELGAQVGSAPVRIAVLGGWTSQETVSLLELFLLERGIRAEFHQSEYNKFYEDAVLDTAALEAFKPQIVYVHTGAMNLRESLSASATQEDFEAAVRRETARFEEIWGSLHAKLGCTIVQNNFEPPLDPLGNYGAVSFGGKRLLVQRLNLELARRAQATKNLIVHDVHSLAARFGADRWNDPRRWFAYKLAVTPDANAALAHSLASLLAAALGKARKCLVLDLDNTLWGGVIGDDGADKIRIGRETPEAEAHTALQEYCLSLQRRGVLLAVCSKNEDAIAKTGFAHPDSVLKLEHFSAFKANWEPKHHNIEAIARELNIGLDSLVFLDDNPAEREIVRGQLPMVAVPEVGDDVSAYPAILAASGYFETVSLSAEDLMRASFYEANADRGEMAAKYASYDEYLAALDMRGEIAPFTAKYFERLAQLINKTNQFNLTTKRHTQAEVEAMAADRGYVTLYGRLADRFGDNGLISILIARLAGETAHIDLWLMSCRVLKRDMELAMLDALVEAAANAGATRLRGTYLRTEKNAMVADHYEKLGFSCVEKAADGSRSEWALEIKQDQPKRNRHIKIAEIETP